MRAKIYTDTWDPFHGCLNNCLGCRAAAQIRQSGGHRDLLYYMHQEQPPETGELHILDAPMLDEVTGKPEDYPFAFDPTFSRYRLKELLSFTKPSNILVCEKGDLFAPWVPDQVVLEILDTARKASLHNYLFLSRFPERYKALSDIPPNFLFGAVIDSPQQLQNAADASAKVRYLVIDPLKEQIDLEKVMERFSKKPEWVVLETMTKTVTITASRKKQLGTLVETCTQNEIPVFVEDQLQMLMGESLPQQLHPLFLKNHSI